MIFTVFVFLAVGLAVGLFLGYSLGKKSSSAESPTCTPNPDIPMTTGPPPPPVIHLKEFEWGDRVNVSGKEINVLDWFDDVMTEENIKNNLM